MIQQTALKNKQLAEINEKKINGKHLASESRIARVHSYARMRESVWRPKM